VKRGGPIKRRTPLKARKGLSPGKGMTRSGKGLKAGSGPVRSRKEAAPVSHGERMHLQAVKRLPCFACGAPGPSDAHHCFHDRATRYGGRKAPHRETIPLCKNCHQDGPRAIHREKRSWRERHGPDWSHVPTVLATIYLDARIDQAGIDRFWADRADLI